METNSQKLSRILRFLVSGSIGAGVNLCVLYILSDIFKIWYLISSIFSVAVSLIVSFLLQKFFTFKDHEVENIHRQASYYAIVSIFSLFFNTALMYLLVSLIGIHYLVSQIISSIVIAVSSYILYKRFVFMERL